MKTCGTCKFWVEPQYKQIINGLPLRKCGRIVMMEESTQWDKDLKYLETRPEFDGVRAFTEDGSSYRADLLTLENFGCVEHKGK